MAVPKKRTSKSKKNSRLAKWTNKATLQAQRAVSLAKSVLNSPVTSFVSNLNTKQDSKLA